MSDKDGTLPAWQDWVAFGLGWVYIIILSAILFATMLTFEQGVTPAAAPTESLIVLTVGAAANLVYGLFIIFPSLARVRPFVFTLKDWVTLGVFLAVVQNNALLRENQLLMIAAAGGAVLFGMMRLGAVVGIVHVIGVVAITVAVPLVQVGVTQLNNVFSDLSIPLMILIMIAILSGVWMYVIENQSKTQREKIARIADSTRTQLSDLQRRTKAIYELSNTLSANLSYEKILDATLNVGRLAMRQEGRQRLVSVVLLFRASDSELAVVTSRGLSHHDEKRTLQGQSGIIAKALKQGIPVIGKDGFNDPELQYFVAFHDIRSVLCIPLRAGYDNYGILLYGSDVQNAFTTDSIELLTAISTQATVALQNAVLYSNLVDEKERIVEVEEDARKKLARDLHDGPTQTISAIAMRMSYIYRLLERQPGDVLPELKKVEEMARNTVKEIRHMLFTLRPLVLENQGLGAALQQLADKVKETHGQNVATYVSPEAEQLLDTAQQGPIFYIVEEAVGNARKHAQAELISVNIYRESELIVVEISDNGVGFNVQAVDANYDQRGSLGMVNMRERTELLNGTLQIESAVGKGTKITVLVPLKETATSTRAKMARAQMPNTKLAMNAISNFNNYYESSQY